MEGNNKRKVRTIIIDGIEIQTNLNAIEIADLMQKNKELERKLKIKDEYSRLIIDTGFDYDGLEKSESLKELIDELVNYAKKSYFCDDKCMIGIGVDENGKEIQYNILNEKINANTIAK